MAEVIITTEGQNGFDAAPRTIQARMLRIFERLENWPQVSGAKLMTGRLLGCYRIRTGDYRIVFHVDGDRVVINKIGHRKDIYK